MKKIFASLALTAATLLCLLGTFQPAFASVTLDTNLHPDFAPAVNFTDNGKPGNEVSYGDFFLQLIAGGLLYLAGPTAILFIALAGLQYTTAHGAQESLEAAKKTLTWAIIGLVIIILSWAIVRTVIQVTITANSPAPASAPATPGGTSAAPSTPAATAPAATSSSGGAASGGNDFGPSNGPAAIPGSDNGSPPAAPGLASA